MNSIPDVTEYFQIFDDYLDFDIKPWDVHGWDEGQMIPERKVALRYMVLGMNIHKNDPALLPTNMLSFMSEYTKPEYKEPETQVKVKTSKYSDLREQVEQEAGGDTKVVVKHRGPNKTGLSSKEMEGFNMAVRRGATSSDVIEKFESRQVGMGKMGPKYIDTTTRSVFWDVPGEDALNENTWNWKAYASKEDVAKVEENSKRKGKR